MMPTYALLSVHLVKSARSQMTTTSLAAAMIVPTVNTLTVTNPSPPVVAHQSVSHC